MGQLPVELSPTYAYLDEYGMEDRSEEWMMLYSQSIDSPDDAEGAVEELEARRLKPCPLFERFIPEHLPAEVTCSGADCME
eukprot:214248-Karenia_brevis.AAC.1